jgi:hypothetical protein
MAVITDVSVAVMNGLLYVEAGGCILRLTAVKLRSRREKEKDRRRGRAVLSVKKVYSYAFIGPAQARRKRVEQRK